MRTTRSIIDKRTFEARGGGHGVSDSDYRLERTTCCGSYAVLDDEIEDLYIDPTDLGKTISTLYDPRTQQPPACPFCGAVDWNLTEVMHAADAPEAWRWALRK